MDQREIASRVIDRNTGWLIMMKVLKLLRVAFFVEDFVALHVEELDRHATNVALGVVLRGIGLAVRESGIAGRG